MNFNFIENKEATNLNPYAIEEKESYYRDLGDIEWSTTGRLDAMYSNAFFYEAVQMITNSIVLAEKGYFDCAFYSLRQSLEMTTTSIYFVDDVDKDNRQAEMDKWRKQENFPQHGRMLQLLVNRKSAFADVREKMKVFFDDLDEVKKKLNKYVHKQGMDKFYTYRGQNFERNLETRKKDFIVFLEKSIGAAAVMRLVVDPMPLLLLDEEIYARTAQLLTENYSSDFVERYIGEEHVAAYKLTNIYNGYYDNIMAEERMLPSVLSVVKDEFIDRDKCEEILSQIGWLDIDARVAVAFTQILPNLVRIYSMDGYTWFFTSTKSDRRHGYNTKDFVELKGKAPTYNLDFHGGYLCIVNMRDNDYFLEQDIPFSENDIALIELYIKMCNDFQLPDSNVTEDK